MSTENSVGKNTMSAIAPDAAVPSGDASKPTIAEDAPGIPSAGINGAAISRSIGAVQGPSAIASQALGIKALIEGRESNPNFGNEFDKAIEDFNKTGEEIEKQVEELRQGKVLPMRFDLKGAEEIIAQMFQQLLQIRGDNSEARIREADAIHGDLSSSFNMVRNLIDKSNPEKEDPSLLENPEAVNDEPGKDNDAEKENGKRSLPSPSPG